MTDLSVIQSTATALAGARASAIKLQDGIVSLVIDVSGLDIPSRNQMEAELKAKLGALPTVTDVRIVMTAEK